MDNGKACGTANRQKVTGPGWPTGPVIRPSPCLPGGPEFRPTGAHCLFFPLSRILDDGRLTPLLRAPPWRRGGAISNFSAAIRGWSERSSAMSHRARIHAPGSDLAEDREFRGILEAVCFCAPDRSWLMQEPNVLEDRSRTQSRPWWRRVLLIGIPLVLAVLVGEFFLAFYWAGRQLDEKLAELDRTDPGWRLEDLEARRAAIAQEENSA